MPQKLGPRAERDEARALDNRAVTRVQLAMLRPLESRGVEAAVSSGLEHGLPLLLAAMSPGRLNGRHPALAAAGPEAADGDAA